MKPRALAVLLLLVAALGAFIWFYERDLPSSEERERRAGLVLPFETAEVVAVEIEEGGTSVRLEREGDAGEPAPAAGSAHWRMTAPLDARADTGLIEGLLSRLSELEKVRVLDEWAPEKVGLSEPRARVLVSVDGSADRVLLVGAEVPASSHMIVAVEGSEEADVVDAAVWTSLSRAPGDWRSRDLFTAKREEISSLRVKRPEGVLRLARHDGDFELEEPLVDVADVDQVNRLLRELTALRVSSFLDGDAAAAAAGLDPPRARVEASLDSGAVFAVDWGGETGSANEHYARVGELVFTTAGDLEGSLMLAPEQWRSRRWTRLRAYQVDELEVSAPDGSTDVVREDGEWRRGDESLTSATVSDLLYAVTDAEAERLAAPAEAARWESAPAVATLRLVEKDGGEDRLELFAATPEGPWPARSAGRETVLLLPAERGADIVAKLEALVTASPEPTPPADKPPAPSE